MRTNFYVDGFNLYYRAVRETPYKWLDLLKFCQQLSPAHVVNRIRYFTARIRPRTGDLQGPQRQQTYIRALETIPNLHVHYGQFRPRIKTRPLVTPVEGLPRFVQIRDTEEKGTDVNLATYLLVDGYNSDYEQAVIVSNDSDFAEPIKIVRNELGLPVGVVNPNIDPSQHAPMELSDAAAFVRRLRERTLRSAQFPPALRDAQGIITKPSVW